MDIKVIVALIGILTVVTSAIVQFVLGRYTERAKKAQELRSQAYVDFVNAVSEIASSCKLNEGKIGLEYLKALTQSKSRVVLIGNDKVVQEVRNYFNKHDMLNSDESFDDFSKIVAAMRKDLYGKNKLSKEVLTEALFGRGGHA